MIQPQGPKSGPMNRRNALATLGLSALPFPLVAASSGSDSPAQNTDSPFLHGIYAPVHEETSKENLKIEGKLPDHLQGTYLRNGPNPRHTPKGRYHWFDGDGMIHAIHLSPVESPQKAEYANRWVRTAGFLEEEKAGKSLYPGLMEIPDLAKVAKGEDGYKNAANTSLCWHHGKLLALWEGGLPYVVDPKTLKTKGQAQFQGAWKGAFTAHPKLDPTTGEMIFFGYGPARPYLKMGILDKNGTLKLQKAIDLPRAIMIHDFAVTPDYALFLDLPQTFSFANLVSGKGVFSWEPQHGARLGVVPRKDGPVSWFPIKPCSVFHTLAAWQEDSQIHLIVCRMISYPADILAGKTDQVPMAERPQLYRYIADLKTGRVTENPLDDPGVDMPRIDDTLTGLKARFGYTMETDFHGLRKHDLLQNTTRKLPLPEGFSCGEPVFVVRPGAKTEDDGHILTLVQPPGSQAGQLWVIASQDFQAGPVAKVHLPNRIPMGFHGIWLPAV